MREPRRYRPGRRSRVSRSDAALRESVCGVFRSVLRHAIPREWRRGGLRTLTAAPAQAPIERVALDHSPSAAKSAAHQTRARDPPCHGRDAAPQASGLAQGRRLAIASNRSYFPAQKMTWLRPGAGGAVVHAFFWGDVLTSKRFDVKTSRVFMRLGKLRLFLRRKLASSTPACAPSRTAVSTNRSTFPSTVGHCCAGTGAYRWGRRCRRVV